MHEAFMTERRALAEDRRSLDAQYGDRSSEAYQEAQRQWRQQNADRLESVRTMAEQMAAESPPPERPQITLEQYQARLPEDMKPAMREFMTERFHMRQARIDAGLDDPDLSAEQRADHRRAFAESQRDRRERIEALSRQVAAESAAQPRPEPPPIGAWQPPEDLPEAMRAYMTERHKLRRQEWEFEQTLTDTDPDDRQAAVRQWRRQHHQQLQPLREQAHQAMQTEAESR